MWVCVFVVECVCSATCAWWELVTATVVFRSVSTSLSAVMERSRAEQTQPPKRPTVLQCLSPVLHPLPPALSHLGVLVELWRRDCGFHPSIAKMYVTGEKK